MSTRWCPSGGPLASSGVCRKARVRRQIGRLRPANVSASLIAFLPHAYGGRS